PRAFSDVANEVDLRWRPHARRRAVDAERAVPAPIFPDQQASKRRDVARQQRRPLLLAEAPVRPYVVYSDDVAAFVCRHQDGADAGEPSASDRWRDTTRVGVADDELVADVRVADPADAQVLAEEPRRGFLAGGGIAQWLQHVVEFEQKVEPCLTV